MSENDIEMPRPGNIGNITQKQDGDGQRDA
jgi:hypothetical protein